MASIQITEVKVCCQSTDNIYFCILFGARQNLTLADFVANGMQCRVSSLRQYSTECGHQADFDCDSYDSRIISSTVRRRSNSTSEI